ncbi:DUF2790 domain-containing protein [Pseudomonas putida]|uniref:DUF2790 domain-containing protein n=1 Tax=Pseudomonas putida TaxID=303 RepID=A0A8I1JIM0_PSEPU|nr:DUF2790 domain-containing protein [Pseudomonas putida]
MKYLFMIAAIALSTNALAIDDSDVAIAEDYRYDQQLDIHKVIKMEPIPRVCGVVKTYMTYEDSEGHRHVLRYSVLGDGCSDN